MSDDVSRPTQAQSSGGIRLAMLGVTAVALLYLAAGNFGSRPAAPADGGAVDGMAELAAKSVAAATAVAAERGATVYALARGQADASVAESQALTDKSIADLRAVFKQVESAGADKEFVAPVRHALADLGRLADERQGTGRKAGRQRQSDLLTYYGSVAESLLAQANRIAGESSDGEIASAVTAAASLARLQQAAGLEQVNVAVALIGNEISKQTQRDAAVLVAAQKSQAEAFRKAASASTAAAFDEVMEDKPAQEVARLRALVADNPQQLSFKGAASMWWEAQGEMLTQLRGVAEAAGADLSAAAAGSGGSGAGGTVLPILALLAGLAAAAGLVYLTPGSAAAAVPLSSSSPATGRNVAAEAKAATAEAAEAKRRERELTKRSETAERRAADADKALTQLRAEQKDLQSQLRDTELLVKHQATYEKTIAQLRAAHASMEKELDTERGIRDNAERAAQQLEATVAQLRSEASGDVNEWEVRGQALLEEKTSLEAAVTRLTADLQGSQTRVSEAVAAREAAEKRGRDLDGNLQVLAAQKSAAEESLAKLQADLGSTESGRAAAAAAKESAEQRGKELQGRLDEVKASLTSELTAKDQRLISLAADYSALEKSLAQVRTELEDHKQKVEAAQAGRTTAEQRLDDTLAQLAEFRATAATEKRRFEQQLATSATEKAALERQAAGLEREAIELRAKTKEAVEGREVAFRRAIEIEAAATAATAGRQAARDAARESSAGTPGPARGAAAQPGRIDLTKLLKDLEAISPPTGPGSSQDPSGNPSRDRPSTAGPKKK